VYSQFSNKLTMGSIPMNFLILPPRISRNDLATQVPHGTDSDELSDYSVGIVLIYLLSFKIVCPDKLGLNFRFPAKTQHARSCYKRLYKNVNIAPEPLDQGKKRYL
jgi:hypothetical protein